MTRTRASAARIGGVAMLVAAAVAGAAAQTCTVPALPAHAVSTCAVGEARALDDVCTVSCEQFYEFSHVPRYTAKLTGAFSSFGRFPDGAQRSQSLSYGEALSSTANSVDGAVTPGLSGGAGTYYVHYNRDQELVVPYAVSSAGASLAGHALTGDAIAAGFTKSGNTITPPAHLWDITPDQDGDMRCYQEWDGRTFFTKQFSTMECTLAACPAASDGLGRPPRLVTARSGLAADGNLEIAFAARSTEWTAQAWRFRDARAPSACNDPAGAGAGGWTHGALDVSSCEKLHLFSRGAADTLSECGFEGPEDGGDVTYYEAVVEVDYTHATGEQVFGVDVSRTTTAAFRVRVELPKSVQVDTSGVAWNSAIELGLLSSQASNPTSKLFTWEFATSVQEPYYLEAVSAAASPPGDFDGVAPAVSGTDVCSGETGACTQTFTVTATAGALVCSLDGTATLTFAVRCRDNFDGACDLPAPATAELTFSYRTDSFCARVAEVAQVTPELVTSTSQGGAPASDFVLQTTLHGRVALTIEGGVAVSRVHLAQLDIASEATVRAVENGAYAGSSDTKFLMSTADQVDGAAHVDFSFQLNTESVSFSAGGATGQATVTLTAVVEVTYADATLQRFTVETQAAPPATTLPVAAQAAIGVTSAAPAAGGSSSTAGSTVLGVSTGTAMVAGVGLVAVVALAAGAAVAVRKRRHSAARRLKASSSTVELNDTAAVQV